MRTVHVFSFLFFSVNLRAISIVNGRAMEPWALAQDFVSLMKSHAHGSGATDLLVTWHPTTTTSIRTKDL